MATTKELLARNRELLLSFGKGRAVERLVSPVGQKPLPWGHFYLQALIPKDYEWRSIIINLYQPIESIPSAESISEDVSVIVHGHPKGITCFSKHKCYVIGYTDEP